MPILLLILLGAGAVYFASRPRPAPFPPALPPGPEPEPEPEPPRASYEDLRALTPDELLALIGDTEQAITGQRQIENLLKESEFDSNTFEQIANNVFMSIQNPAQEIAYETLMDAILILLEKRAYESVGQPTAEKAPDEEPNIIEQLWGEETVKLVNQAIESKDAKTLEGYVTKAFEQYSQANDQNAVMVYQYLFDEYKKIA